VGIDHSHPLRPARHNMPLALEHPKPINEYLASEIAGGRVLGPFPRGSIPGRQINCLGVVPKGHTPGWWRLVTDLSFPEGGSVNDGIDPTLCSLHYTSVDRVAQVGWLHFLLLPRQALPLAYPPVQTFFPLSTFCLQESLGKAGNFPKCATQSTDCANSYTLCGTYVTVHEQIRHNAHRTMSRYGSICQHMYFSACFILLHQWMFQGLYLL